MYVRVVSFQGADDVEAGIRFLHDTVSPLLHQQKGFRGLTASVDRARGALGVLSLWETEADREASESAVQKSRAEGARILGSEPRVEHFEQVLEQMSGVPSVGSPLQLQRVSMDPARVDENLEYFRREVLPSIVAQPGFLALRQMVDRATGEAVVGTVWTDAAAMRAAAEAADERRRQTGRRVTFGERSEREIAYVDLP